MVILILRSPLTVDPPSRPSTMQTLFSIILPLLAIRLFLNTVPSLYLSSPNPPPLTATAQYSYINHRPAFSLVFIRRSSSSSPFRPPVFNSRRNIVFILLLSGDVEINPDPNCPFSRRPPRSSNETFTLYSLDIRSLLNTKNSTALTDLASSSRPPDLIAVQETKISTSSTDAHISYSKPPGYSLRRFYAPSACRGASPRCLQSQRRRFYASSACRGAIPRRLSSQRRRFYAPSLKCHIRRDFKDTATSRRPPPPLR